MYFWRISCCLQQVWDLKSASPLVAFLVLLDVSVKVIGVSYPITTSATSITDSAAISKTWAKGQVCQAHVLSTQIWNHCHNSCCSGYNIPVHNHDTLWQTCTATCIHDNYNNILGRQAWFDKTFFPKFLKFTERGNCIVAQTFRKSMFLLAIVFKVNYILQGCYFWSYWFQLIQQLCVIDRDIYDGTIATKGVAVKPTPEPLNSFINR